VDLRECGRALADGVQGQRVLVDCFLVGAPAVEAAGCAKVLVVLGTEPVVETFLGGERLFLLFDAGKGAVGQDWEKVVGVVLSGVEADLLAVAHLSINFY
jgi:hypothetical protein